MSLIEKMDSAATEFYVNLTNKISKKTNLEPEKIVDYTYGISASCLICSATSNNSLLGTIINAGIALVPTFKTMHPFGRMSRIISDIPDDRIKISNIIFQSLAIYLTSVDFTVASVIYSLGYETEAIEYIIRELPEDIGFITFAAGNYMEKNKN